MNIPDIYAYLMACRRKLWTALDEVSDEVLDRHLLQGELFHSVRDLVFHMAIVEDGWVNVDIRAREPALETFPDLKDVGPASIRTPLSRLLAYAQAVEAKTLAYLPTLTDADLAQVVRPEDWRGLPFTVDGLLWHVFIHEMRHTAQIAALLRTQAIEPPVLDLLFYLADQEIRKLGGEGL